jgi:tetratricopeptide (TPR) repeat protein
LAGAFCAEFSGVLHSFSRRFQGLAKNERRANIWKGGIVRLKDAKVLMLILFSFTFWQIAACLQSRASLVSIDKKFLKPPAAIKNFTFGYNDFIASLLWVRLVQNLEYCEDGKYTAEDYVQPNNEVPDKLTGILSRQLRPSKCHLGWVYSMTDVITEIQPRFYLAYDVGAIFLSIAVDDREGARLIFEKGVKQYPKDWQLNYKAGYHYLWEIQDPQRAAQLFNQAAQNGAPQWVNALSAALYTKVGQARLAKTILENTLENHPTGFDVERIKMRLEEVNKILEENP